MCGIWALFGYDHTVSSQLHHALEVAHRGPDFLRVETIPHFNHCFLAFHRLSIMDDLTGQQPMRLYTLPHLRLMYNGEIYNYKELITKYGFECSTKMDGEVILHLYNKFGAKKTFELLDGVFAATIFETENGTFHIGRDTFGVRPLFTIHPSSGELGICSEAKGLVGLTQNNGDIVQINPFKPGHYATFKICKETGKSELLVEEPFTDVDIPPVFDVPVQMTADVKENIRNLLTDAVRKRMMAERRIGCLLSGGLDSSLVAGLVVKIAKEMGITYPIQTFSIGLQSSPDIKHARKCADLLGTEHHEVIVSSQEGFDAIAACNYSLECYDIITNRASICMYLLAKYIREKTDTTVVFSGEGSDELTQGYIYFHKAPDADQAREESKRLLRDVHLYDILRPDRTLSAHGLELRVPYLDKAFTSYYLSIDKHLVQPQNGIEKYLLRSAFDGHLKDFIPDDVLWRPKEEFCDGVSKKEESWSVQLERYAKTIISEKEMLNAPQKFPINTPKTYESFLYRNLFESKFSSQLKLTPYIWLPKWIPNVDDPSARVLKHYKQ